MGSAESTKEFTDLHLSHVVLLLLAPLFYLLMILLMIRKPLQFHSEVVAFMAPETRLEH